MGEPPDPFFFYSAGLFHDSVCSDQFGNSIRSVQITLFVDGIMEFGVYAVDAPHPMGPQLFSPDAAGKVDAFDAICPE